MIDVKKKI